MTKCSIKYKVAICGRTKCITNKSLLVYEQLCRKGCRECNTHNWLTPPIYLSIYLRNKEELAVYQEVHTNLEPLNMWKLAKKHPNQKTSIIMLVNIMCGNVPPIFNSWTYSNGTTRCAFCHLEITNVNFHFIITCGNFNEWRNNLWDELMDKLPIEQLARIYAMDEIDLYTTIIGGKIPDLNNYLTFDTEFCLIVVKHMRKLLTSIDSSDWFKKK